MRDRTVTDGAVTGPGDAPLVRVLRGAPDDDEIAAFTLVLLALGAERGARSQPAPPTRLPRRWTDDRPWSADLAA